MSELFSFSNIIAEGRTVIDYTQDIKSIRSFTKGVQAVRNCQIARTADKQAWNDVGRWSYQVEAFFDWGYACSQFWTLVEMLPALAVNGIDGSKMFIAGVGVASISAFRSTCTNDKTKRWGIMAVSDGTMRNVNVLKFSTSVLYKSILLYQDWGKGGKWKMVRNIGIVIMLAMALTYACFAYYQEGKAPEDNWKPGLSRMFLYNDPIKPINKDSWLSHFSFIPQYAAGACIRRYLGLAITVSSFMVYRESRL